MEEIGVLRAGATRSQGEIRETEKEGEGRGRRGKGEGRG